MPKFAKGSAEAKEWGRKMKLARGKKGGKCGGDAIDDNILKVGNAFGAPITAGIKAETGVDVPNPFELGYNLGQNVIAPAMFKVLPPEKVHQFFQDTGAKFRDAGSKIKNFFRTGRGMKTAIYNNSMRGGRALKPAYQQAMLNHLVSHITDPNEPLDTRDFHQAKQIINNIQQQKGEGLLPFSQYHQLTNPPFSQYPQISTKPFNQYSQKVSMNPFQLDKAKSDFISKLPSHLMSMGDILWNKHLQGHGLVGEGWMSNLWYTGSAKAPSRTWAEELRVLLSSNPDLTAREIHNAKMDYYKSTKEAKRTRPVAGDEDWEELDPHRNSQERAFDEMMASKAKAERDIQYPSAENGKSAKGLRCNYRVSHKHGGAFTDWEGTVKETLKLHPYNMGGNTNNGVMRVPHAQSLVHMGKGVIDEMYNFDSNYMARVYNSRNLGANGRVCL